MSPIVTAVFRSAGRAAERPAGQKRTPVQLRPADRPKTEPAGGGRCPRRASRHRRTRARRGLGHTHHNAHLVRAHNPAHAHGAAAGMNIPVFPGTAISCGGLRQYASRARRRASGAGQPADSSRSRTPAMVPVQHSSAGSAKCPATTAAAPPSRPTVARLNGSPVRWPIYRPSRSSSTRASCYGCYDWGHV